MIFLTLGEKKKVTQINIFVSAQEEGEEKRQK